MATTRIAIVGAGPRGLTVLERIVANERHRRSGELEIVVFDPTGPGVGCHDPDQPEHLLVNTVAGQITLFSDPTVVGAGPMLSGPSFHQWLQDEHRRRGIDPRRTNVASPDAYQSRGLFGRYLHWVYHYVCAMAPAHVRIQLVRSSVQRAHRADDLWLLKTEGDSFCVDHLFLTTGHTKPRMPDVDIELPALPGHPRTTVIDDPYPMRQTLAQIAPGASVGIEGMGLTTFDALAELTVGRGGRFVASSKNGEKRYIPSGREPKIIAYSRSGLPLTARAVNQKGVSSQYKARFLFVDDIRALRRVRKLDFVNDILPLLRAEMEFAYCEAYLRQQRDPLSAMLFCNQFVCADADQRRTLIARYVPARDRFSWDRCMAPIPAQALATPANFDTWFKAHLRQDLAEARKGNLDSPIKAASDVLRDLRDTLRAAIDYGGLTEASHRWLLSQFVPVMNRIAVGPPESRIAEMLALIDAGVLQAGLGPQAHAEQPAEGGRMRIRSTLWADQSTEIDVLIKARVSLHGPEQDASPLMRDLLDAGHVRPFRNGDFHPGGIEVDRNFNWVSRQGEVLSNAWALGIPTEGVKFYTFVVPRPGVNSTALVDAGRAVTQMLSLVRGQDSPVAEPPVDAPLPSEERASAFASLYGALP